MSSAPLRTPITPHAKSKKSAIVIIPFCLSIEVLFFICLHYSCIGLSLSVTVATNLSLLKAGNLSVDGEYRS